MTRAGVLLRRRGDIESNRSMLEAIGVVAKALQVEVRPTEFGEPEEYEGGFSAWADERVGGLVMTDHSVLIANVGAIGALAAKHRLPSVGPLELPQVGGLMAYGVNFSEMFRRKAGEQAPAES